MNGFIDQTLFWIGSLSLASAWREEAKSYHENTETFVASKHKRNSAQFPDKFANISIYPDKMKTFPYVRKRGFIFEVKWIALQSARINHSECSKSGKNKKIG